MCRSQIFRSSGVKGLAEVRMPLFLPRLTISVLRPSLEYSPSVTSLPPSTPMEPVIVSGSA